MSDADSRVNQFLSTVTDLSERRRAEEDKLALERRVQHAQKLESLGVLAGGIAHDFNNILVAILGNADLALADLSPMSPVRGNLQEIQKATKRAAELANQMLAYSGKGRFVVEPIDPGKLIEEISHLLEISITKKAVLKLNFAENLPTFSGSVTQIRQIIMYLITNASLGIGESSGVIALSTGAMDCDRTYLDDVNNVLPHSLDEQQPEGVYTYFEVADTGCGMDAEIIEKIFDPFFTTKLTGRGLGMSAVLGIVRGHKGVLKIDSQVGKGTTFRVFFPANEPSDNDVAVRRKDKAEVKDWRGSGTVLIVDDEETVCAVGKQILERMGFSVLMAPDGRAALKVFREHADEIVCVLLDLTMPHMDGKEAFRAMQRLHPGVRVILCSGYNEQDAIGRLTGIGLAGFIQKPFNMATLKEKLVEVLAAGESDQ
jgi:signal transduction histidine kinase/CheY-like chemotaxis protein